MDFFSDPKVILQFQILQKQFLPALWDTLYSLSLQTIFAYLIGLPLGVLLVIGA